jgi:NAD(P)-dependent dehydrogenase (short-subunit alcohol dehydrogenase family)
MKVLIFGGGGIAEGIFQTLKQDDVHVLSAADCNVRFTVQPNSAVAALKPDIVINCAGISYVSKVEKSDEWHWEQQIMVNLFGSYNIARAAVSYSAAIQIYIASVAGLYGKPEHSAYCASKAGVRSLVQSLAMEGYGAYAISPGRVDTPMRQRDYPNDTPGSRLKPTDIGKVVQEIIDGKFDPGDNIIIRKEGLEKIIREVDKGEPWKTKLKVGQPVTI